MRLPGPAGMRRVRFAAEATVFLMALAVFAKAALIMAAPAPPLPQLPVEAAPALYAVAAAAGGHPFRDADESPAASSAPLTESALNIVLYGTWRSSAGASATIAADGAPQRKVAAGEEIVSGVTLEEVQDEFVVINNNGAREAVAIVNRKVDMSAPAPADEDASEVAGDDATAPSSAPLRDGAPLTVSAETGMPLAERPADTLAAAAPHETN